MVTKSMIDKLGNIICKNNLDESNITKEDNSIIDDWRQAHLGPLTEVTLKMQDWLQDLAPSICMAQRLKRKPQIIKKLKRAHPMRLSQMQDIGGCRAIFSSNEEIDEAVKLINDKVRHKFFRIIDTADYRLTGRQESGYRALHLIFERTGYKVEMQLRTRIQHAWAEEVERTSIICQSALKEGEGPDEVKAYFKTVSAVLSNLDFNKPISKVSIRQVEASRLLIRNIIDEERKHLLKGFTINGKHLRGMKKKEVQRQKQKKMNNWMFVFNWGKGEFHSWTLMPNDPFEAAKEYSDKERYWSFADGYEVVVVGAQSIENIERTHSHYFGVNSFDVYLKEIGIQTNYDRLNVETSEEARLIISILSKKGIWGSKTMLVETLKEELLLKMANPEMYLEELFLNGYLVGSIVKGAVALNTDKKSDIENYL